MSDCNIFQEFKTVEISDISHELEIMIDRYLYIKRKSNTKKCYKEGFILVSIIPYFIEEYTQRGLYDSLYSTNNLSNNDSLRIKIGSVYKVFICLINKNNYAFKGKFSIMPIYYYNYRGYRILLRSVIPLQFNEIGERKFHVLENPNYKNNCKCDNYDFSLETIFTWGYKSVTEVRYRDIITPEGSPREMFR
jgi:hypothetical protein